MAWVLLLLTIILEVAGTISMKLSEGLTKWLPSVLLFVFYGACFTIFSFVVTKIELSIAYAIWSGLGTVVIVIIGILYFHESFSLLKAVFVLCIIVGVIGLKLVAPTE
ncbi:DMT family transporter [Bacillus suaedae]|uniref:Multidrug efflux SMR transporter n=1 Tax=Halalkalibacter suaedae TaxID=2822140 RepID=A0A940WYQ0_9BACI|nr:multidrug efflux SMR transporter [Bacillus suaedae]MBP3953242.1 multidrug efflux SMR transporter [Bacillus suaedae]